MKWPIFVRRLVEVAPGRAPTDDEVHATLIDTADDDDERDWFEVEEAGREILREHDHAADRLPLISFVWQTDAVFSSSLSVEWIAGDGCGLLVERNSFDAESDFVILACLAEPLKAGARCPASRTSRPRSWATAAPDGQRLVPGPSSGGRSNCIDSSPWRPREGSAGGRWGPRCRRWFRWP
jgi:hypothetical protein